MLKALSIIVILLTCASAGLVLALYAPPVSFYSGMVVPSNRDKGQQHPVTTTPSVEHFREAQELIGISDTVVLNLKDQDSEQVLALWQDFATFKALQEAVNWTEPVNLYAYYTDFDFAMETARLTIGYDINQLNRTASVAKLKAVSPSLRNNSTASGQYQRHTVYGTTSTAVFKAWIGLSRTRKPRAVLEIYKLDRQGSITRVRLEVKYKQ